MRVYLFVILFSIFCIANSLNAQTYVFGQLTGSPNMITTGWNLNGNAAIGDTPGDIDNFPNELILTNANNNQSGGIFYNTPINLSICQKWTVEFDYRIWGGSAADGLAFCFLSVPPAGFVSGGGVGIPGTANGLKVVLDTWNNCGGPNPELQIYSGVGYDECIAGIVKLENTTGNLNFVRSNSYQPVKITYNNGLIALFINNIQYLTANFTIGFTGYMGFTASTGGATDQHSIRNVIIYTDQAQSNAGVDVTTCSNDPVSIGVAPNVANSYSWSPATGLSSASVANPIVTLPNTTGATITQTYTVTTSLANAPGLCPTTDQVVVTVHPEYNISSNITSCSGQYILNGQIITQSGTYNTALTTVFGCDSLVNLNITILSAPVVNTGQNITLCSGEIGNLGMSPQVGYSYSWSPNTGLSAANVANPTVQLSNMNSNAPIVQTYTLTVTDNNSSAGCSASAQVGVTIFPEHQNTIQDTLCNGGPFYYNGQAYAQSGIYIDSSQTSSGCDSITTIQIAISQTPVFNVDDTLICIGQQINVFPQSTFSNITYSWLAQSTTNAVIAPSLSLTPAQTVSYMVSAIDSFLCYYTDNFTLTVAPLPLLSLSANQITLCAHDTLQLTASGANAYTWIGPVSFANNNQNQSVILPVTGVYQVTGITQNGCQDSLAVSITVNPVPQLQITPDQGICPGFSANINVSGAVNYLWDNIAISGDGGTVTPISTTTYQVIGLNVFNCLDTASTTVNVYPQPSASFTASPLILTNDDPTVSFTSLAQNAANTIWDFGDGSTLQSNQNQFDYTYPFVEDQTYTVTLTVESAEGCIDQSQVQIQIKGGIIYYVPNTFTPDGDAFNNLFTPIFTTGFDPESFHMTILNRWGEIVFESFDPKGGWDGKIDIYDAQEGTYTYIIAFKTVNSDEMKSVTGHVLLLR